MINPPPTGGSVFLSNLHYFLAQTDGTYAWPNSSSGDLLKRAKKEIEHLRKELALAATNLPIGSTAYQRATQALDEIE